MFLLYSFLPWIVLVVIHFFLYPVLLLAAGKILKIEHKNFKFWECFWMNFVAALFASFVNGFSVYVGLAVFLLLLGVMIKGRWQLDYKKLFSVLGLMLVFGFALTFVERYIVYLLLVNMY